MYIHIGSSVLEWVKIVNPSFIEIRIKKLGCDIKGYFVCTVGLEIFGE